jgi:tetratricopeptide (TPR) repeat protein
MEKRWPAWHRQQAAECERDRNWFAAAFHLGRLLETEPGQPLLRARRGRALLELGRTDRGLADLTHPGVAGSSDWQALSWHARACLVAGDTAGYRRACARLLERFDQTPDPGLANNVAWACALAPGAVRDLGRVVKTAEGAAARSPKDPSVLNTLGCVLLRAGRTRESIAALERALQLRLALEGGTVGHELALASDELLLALAYQQLGQGRDARRWQDRAAARLESGEAPVRAGALAAAGAGGPLLVLAAWHSELPDPRRQQLGWEDWLDLQLLRREVRAALRPVDR